jgi:hypothetical protein
VVKVCELHVKDIASRDAVILALANNNYTISVEEKESSSSFATSGNIIKVEV